jgi:predicted acetyltransferase
MEKPETDKVDLEYYEVLEVTKEATKGEIKKAYFMKAKIYHPDKNPDDPNAETMFKKISEAYQVLSDDEKRAIYDKHGKAGLERVGSSGSGGDGMDPRELFSMLFGGGKFDDCFGEMSFATIIDLQMSGIINEDELMEKMKNKQDDRINNLKTALVEKIKLAETGSQKDFEALIQADVEAKIDAPGGLSLVAFVGEIYDQEATQHGNKFLGFFAEIKEKTQLMSQAFSAVGSVVNYEQAQIDMERKLEEGEIETEEQLQQMQQRVTDHGLNTMWKIGKLEINGVVRQVCEEVLGNKEVDKKIRSKRVKAVKTMGSMYKKAAKKLKKQRKEEEKEKKKSVTSTPANTPRGNTNSNAPNNSNNNMTVESKALDDGAIVLAK